MSLLCGPIWIWTTPFFTRGEAREALVVQGMAERGEWILPRVYGEGVPSKPPAMHWIGAGIASVFGEVREWMVRFPSALAAVLTALGFTVWLLRQGYKEQAFVASLILMTTFEWCRASTAARVDMALAGFATLGSIGLFEFAKSQRWIWFVLSVLGCAGAVLVKGPVGVVLPLASFGVFVLLTIPKKSFSNGLLGVCIGTLSLAPYALWFLLAQEQGGQLFLDKMYYENIARMAGTTGDAPHAHGAPYLWLMFLVGLLPWSVMVAIRIKSVGSLLRRMFDDVKLGNRSLELFSGIVVSLYLLFYSVPESKRSVYLLAAYPWVCFLGAKLLVSTYSQLAIKRVIYGSLLVIIVSLALILPLQARRLSEKQFAAAIADHIVPTARLASYDFEFYGTSFYLRRLMTTYPVGDLREGDQVVFFDEKRQQLLTQLPPSYKLTTVICPDFGVIKRGKSACIATVAR